VLLEWVNVDGGRHTHYFRYWSNNLKQDASATTCTMRNELCIGSNPLDLVNGFDVGGTVWKGTDSAAVSYHCGKVIYGKTILSSELLVAINVQVEVPVHGK
jgi:hypothetical protein